VHVETLPLRVCKVTQIYSDVGPVPRQNKAHVGVDLRDFTHCALVEGCLEYSRFPRGPESEAAILSESRVRLPRTSLLSLHCTV